MGERLSAPVRLAVAGSMLLNSACGKISNPLPIDLIFNHRNTGITVGVEISPQNGDPSSLSFTIYDKGISIWSSVTLPAPYGLSVKNLDGAGWWFNPGTGEWEAFNTYFTPSEY